MEIINKPLTNQQNQTTFLGINCCLRWSEVVCTMLRDNSYFCSRCLNLTQQFYRDVNNGKRQQQYTSGSNPE